ncbi:MAG: hypothetical protein AAF564_06080 [Bacteroidota bacterium]
MSQTYFVKRRFHIGYSLLGRQIRNRITDQHYAEGVFILTFAAVFFSLVIANYLGWAVMQAILINPSNDITNPESVTMGFWIGQLALGALFLFGCLLGFKPALMVKHEAGRGLYIKQGKREAVVPTEDITSATLIPAKRYHRHYAKYLGTRAFLVKMPAALVLISTKGGPVILGLSDQDQKELLNALQPQSEKIVFPSLSPTL